MAGSHLTNDEANLWKKSHYSELSSEIFHRLIKFEELFKDKITTI